MKKRLRKKLHLGEFQALCFRATARLAERAEDTRLDGLLVDFVEFIESRDLLCGGGVNPRERSFSMYVEHGPKSCTDEDREAVGAWLRARPDLIGVEVHPLEDGFYPDGPRKRR